MSSGETMSSGEAMGSVGANHAAAIPPTTTEEAPKMSKNALKRLRRMQEWEDGKEDRKKRRREKRTATKARQREHRATLLANGADPATLFPKKTPARLVPVSLILDCDFEQYMTDKERVSMTSQVTRCYSENRNGKFKAHFWISGWGGQMRERFERTMENQHLHWKGVGFEEGDFLAAAVKAREAMRSETKGGEMADSLRRSAESETTWVKDAKEPFPLGAGTPMPDLDEAYKDVVYLTSESPYTLQRLEPYTSYIIGGLVDKNREKGLCYRRAVQRGIRTARLPIGQYMVMQSRQILATNHVVEIMAKWLDCEDWGSAFTQVIPKRKGGRLIGQHDGDSALETKGEDSENGDVDEDGKEDEDDDEAGAAAEKGDSL
ncbi:hypothetical protein E4U32_001409 [Claviceps aff. humidiphila group G2b]|nr:hypothetical protein E4U32_001409 [Claviceps aff. humidiphila group G2b]